VSSAIVWLRNGKPGAKHRIEFSFGGTLGHPATRARVAARRLQCEGNWSGMLAAARMSPRAASWPPAAWRRPLKGDCQRDIPRQCLRPILPAARRLKADEVPAGEGGEQDTDRERSTQEAVDVILDGMRWLELDADEVRISSRSATRATGRSSPSYPSAARPTAAIARAQSWTRCERIERALRWTPAV
jgi:hypothetical protein